MYNDPSAKDLLAQYPRQYAEGGQVNPVPQFSAPVVPKARTQLNEFTPGLSASQLYARDRAAQDALLTSSYNQTGAKPLSNSEYRALQQKMRSGELNAANIQNDLITPVYQYRVAKAYAAIGRTGPIVPMSEINAPGATAETYKGVDKEGYDYWLNKLKSGEISGKDFQNAFLTSASQAPTGANAKLQLDATNKARAALGLKAITEKELPGYQAPPATKQPWNAGYNTGSLNNMVGQPWQTTLNLIKPLTAPATPTPTVVGNVTNPGQNNYTLKAVEFGAAGNTPTQLFNEGGDVKKYDEPDRQSGMSDEDREKLAMMIEQRALQSARVDAGPMQLSAIPSSRQEGRYDVRAEGDLYGVRPYADYDVKEERLRELGVKHRGQSDLGDYELQYAMDPETKQARVVGAIRKQLSPTSSISAQGMYMPNDYKDAYNVGVNYRKEFAEGGDVKK